VALDEGQVRAGRPRYRSLLLDTFQRTSAIISRRDNEPGSVADFGTAKDLFPQIAKHASNF
jgi:hypothetical protein